MIADTENMLLPGAATYSTCSTAIYLPFIVPSNHCHNFDITYGHRTSKTVANTCSYPLF